MTLIRKLALWISEIVVRYASPGCKDWAEGLSREAAVIENDWSALGWALGSVRVLFDRREAPLRSLDNISSVTWSFVETKRVDAIGIWSLFFIFGSQFAFSFFKAKNGVAYIGSALVVFSMLSLGICSLIEQRRLDALRNTDTRDDVLIYKMELERSRDLPWSPRGWCIFTGILVLFLGGFLARHGEITPGHDPSVLFMDFLGVMWLIYRRRRINRRRLEQLEALLAEKS